MIEPRMTPTAPQQSGELQNLGKREAPQNTPLAQDIDVGAVNRQNQIQRQTEDFNTYLNGNQMTTLLKADPPPSNVFDPAAEITQNSALQGYGALGQNQAV